MVTVTVPEVPELAVPVAAGAHLLNVIKPETVPELLLERVSVVVPAPDTTCVYVEPAVLMPVPATYQPLMSLGVAFENVIVFVPELPPDAVWR